MKTASGSSGLDAVAADALVLPAASTKRRRWFAISTVATAPPSGGRAPGCQAAVRTRWRSSACRASGWSEAASLHRWSTKSDTRVRHCWTLSIRCVRSCSGMQQKGGREQMAWDIVGALDLRDLGRLLGRGEGGRRRHDGLIAVVSLPRAFVFRIELDDPHPVPMDPGQAELRDGPGAHPHPQWDRLEALWESFYPIAGLDEPTAHPALDFEETLPAFVALLVNHRPQALRGRSLAEVMSVADRQPARLAARYRGMEACSARMRIAPPTLAFAVIGQARAEGKISPEDESRLLANLLTYWALRGTLDISEPVRFTCACQDRGAKHSKPNQTQEKLWLTKNIKIKLIAEPFAVTAGNVVKLRAETSVNAGELAEQCFNDKLRSPSASQARR